MKTAKTPPAHLAFAELPDNERALIRSVLNALNRAKNFDEANSLALHHKRHDARPPRRVERQAPIPDELLNAMNEDAADAKHAAFWDQYFKEEFGVLRESLKYLAHHGRIADGYIETLISSFDAYVVATPMVKVSRDGGVSIRTPFRFTDAQGAAAFVILRLAQLSSDKPAVLCCDECTTFALILPSVGSRMSRFCSPKCRNRSGQRKFRTSPAGITAAAAKRKARNVARLAKAARHK